MVRRYEGRPCDPDVSGADCTPVDFRAWMRDMGTTFAKSIPNLIDYPSRDYYELIEGYYHPRVSACINYLRTLVDDGGATETAVIDSALEDIPLQTSASNIICRSGVRHRMSGARCGHCLWTGDWIYTGRMLQAQKLLMCSPASLKMRMTAKERNAPG